MEYQKGSRKQALLFADFPEISEAEKDRITDQIRELGGLTFTLYLDEDGWTAQCNEVSGIIAGGRETNPSPEVLEEGMRQAIFAAFSVDASPKEAPGFSYSVAPGSEVRA